MSKIYTSADQLIGHTPLLELTHYREEGKPERTYSGQAGSISIPPVPSRTVLPRA